MLNTFTADSLADEPKIVQNLIQCLHMPAHIRPKMNSVSNLDRFGLLRLSGTGVIWGHKAELHFFKLWTDRQPNLYYLQLTN